MPRTGAFDRCGDRVGVPQDGEGDKETAADWVMRTKFVSIAQRRISYHFDIWEFPDTVGQVFLYCIGA